MTKVRHPIIPELQLPTFLVRYSIFTDWIACTGTLVREANHDFQHHGCLQRPRLVASGSSCGCQRQPLRGAHFLLCSSLAAAGISVGESSAA